MDQESHLQDARSSRTTTKPVCRRRTPV